MAWRCKVVKWQIYKRFKILSGNNERSAAYSSVYVCSIRTCKRTHFMPRIIKDVWVTVMIKDDKILKTFYFKDYITRCKYFQFADYNNTIKLVNIFTNSHYKWDFDQYCILFIN